MRTSDVVSTTNQGSAPWFLSASSAPTAARFTDAPAATSARITSMRDELVAASSGVHPSVCTAHITRVGFAIDCALVNQVPASHSSQDTRTNTLTSALPPLIIALLLPITTARTTHTNASHCRVHTASSASHQAYTTVCSTHNYTTSHRNVPKQDSHTHKQVRTNSPRLDSQLLRDPQEPSLPPHARSDWR